jgi:Flp pilus assembly protein TadG
MLGAFRRLHQEERGSVIIFFVGFLPVAFAIAAFVIDSANFFEHRRHLQLQADAGALATAQEFSGCFTDPSAANAAIETAAVDYSGATHNAQIGPPDAQSRVQTRLNATDYDADSYSDGDPCDVGFLDVKLTEKNTLPFFAFIDSHDVRATARVQIFKLSASDKMLPIAVPDPDPKVAKAMFVDESTGSVLATTPLTRKDNQNGLAIWDNAEAAVPVPITAAHVGVRIALGGGTSLTCGQVLVDCYDRQSSNGIVHIQGWTAEGTAAPRTPIARRVDLLPGSCGDAYFSANAAGCGLGIEATIDFGADPLVLQAQVDATIGGTSVPLIYTPATGRWSAAGGIPVPANGGPIDVGFHWRISKNADGTNCSPNSSCRGDIAPQQRHFSANADRSGPIALAQVSEDAGPAPANAFRRCSAGFTSCTHNLVVKIGIKGGLALSDLDDPPVRLRVVGGSQNQSLDCDPIKSNLKDELATGCSPSYTSYTGPDPCPSSVNDLWAIPNPPNSWDCVAVQTGTAANQVAEGLNTRILGNPKPSTCPEENRNHWPIVQAGDRRIVFVLVTPFGAFNGSGSTTVPVMRLASFYITGWTGQGGGFDNPCLAVGDEMPTNPAEIVGRFIKYVDTPNEGGADEETCDFDAIEPCTAVLVK